MKKLIRLTESDLHRIVEGSVRRALNELDWKTYMNAAKKSHDRLRNGDEDEDRYANFTGAARKSFMKKYSTLHFHKPRHINPQRGEIEANGYQANRFNANFDYPDYVDDHTNVYGPKVTADVHDDYVKEFDNMPEVTFNSVNYHSDPEMRRGVQFDDGWDDNGFQHTRTKLNNRDYPMRYDPVTFAYNDINHYNTGKSKYRKGKGWKD